MLSFGMHLPGFNATGWWYESYFLLAIPLSFLMAALAGLAMERTVIRFLYRRPLESLLATWGVSFVMQQLFRMVFGANNVQVNSPSWLLGHFSLNDVTFGYNRVFVICFAMVIVIGTWLLLTKTPLGLLIRAVMQNRAMASVPGGPHRPCQHAHLRVRLWPGGVGGRVSLSDWQRRPQPGPDLYRGQFYDGRTRRRRQHRGHGVLRHSASAPSDQVLQQTTGSPGDWKNCGLDYHHSLSTMETRRPFCQPQPQPGLSYAALPRRNRKMGRCDCGNHPAWW
jgi:hypothetical protein